MTSEHAFWGFVGALIGALLLWLSELGERQLSRISRIWTSFRIRSAVRALEREPDRGRQRAIEYLTSVLRDPRIDAEPIELAVRAIVDRIRRRAASHEIYGELTILTAVAEHHDNGYWPELFELMLAASSTVAEIVDGAREPRVIEAARELQDILRARTA